MQKYKLVWDELVIQQGNMIKKKNEDPLSHLNYNHLATLGMGEIFRLELEATEASLDDIIERGH